MKCENCEKELINEHPYRTSPKPIEKLTEKIEKPPIILYKNILGIILLIAGVVISSISSPTALRFNVGLISGLFLLISSTYGLVRLGIFLFDKIDHKKYILKNEIKENGYWILLAFWLSGLVLLSVGGFLVLALYKLIGLSYIFGSYIVQNL